jgi:acyl-CoA synthetase (AMP-forming)/AMP-acid ligase II
VAESLRLPDAVQSLPAVIAWWAAQTPDAPALQTLDRPPLTYRTLHDRMSHGAHRLRGLGIAREDRVALILGDGLDATVALLAVMGAATAAPFGLIHTPAELERDLGRLGARLLVVDPDRAPAAAAVAAGLGLPVVTLPRLGPEDSGEQCTGPSPSGESVDPAAVMLIAHTSGTTALPKRVPVTHRMQLAAARARNARREIGPYDTGLLLAPIASVMFLTSLITMLAAGGSAVVLPALGPAAALRANHHLRPTWMQAGLPLFGAMLQALPRHPELAWNPRLRLVTWGGAGADRSLADRLSTAFGVPSDGTYGLSEASAVALPGRPGTNKLDSVGEAAACEIRIVGDDGRVLPAGERGEIVVRGPSLFAGYLDDPETTAAAFTPDGWFRTGDLGHLDAAGALFVAGRVKDQINRGGAKIAPAEVEAVLLAHPAIADAAVFAVPDPALGEEAVAAVVLRPGTTATPRELRAWMLDRLATTKAPRRIWFVSALPRTETGKVRRAELRRLWGEREA